MEIDSRIFVGFLVKGLFFCLYVVFTFGYFYIRIYSRLRFFCRAVRLGGVI